ncbi:MAG: lipid-A-disaccharide synthase [Verrucomicrobia bacterium]|nr:MAG: lipid-A-disaccharide synthase [Verrucomicrobiota bacterium]
MSPASPRSLPTRALPRLAAPAEGRVDLLVIAGEHSGDEHGASLLRALKSKEPGLSVCALGGPKLGAAGAHLLYDLTASSVVGFVEVLKNYSFFKALFDEVLRWIDDHRPRAVCFIDYPGMNLRLAAALNQRGLAAKSGGPVTLLFYISPQIWAWKAGRRFQMAQHLDGLACIFPFEVACYTDTDLPAYFVGHPFLADDYSPPVKYDPAAPVLLLPGSRKQAVGRIWPILRAGHAAYGRRAAQVIYPSESIREVIAATGVPRDVTLVANTGDVVAASAVLTSSGTMSLHCALAGLPGAIAYRANPVTYLLGRLLVKIPYLGINNLLLKAPMYPEYLQGAATPHALAAELRSCLEDPARRTSTEAQAEALKTILRQPANGTAADWLLRRAGFADKG